MLILDDEEIFKRAKFLRDCGRNTTSSYQIDEISCKYMPSNIQAALAYAQFLRINELIGKKREIFSWYRKHLSGVEDICLNQENENVENGAWATSLVFGKSHNMSKEKMIAELIKLNLPTRPFFQPLSSQPGYAKKGFDTKEYRIKNPVSYDVSSRGITLPAAFELTEDQAKEYCDGIKSILEKNITVKYEVVKK
jgi:perosamine synthetase